MIENITKNFLRKSKLCRPVIATLIAVLFVIPFTVCAADADQCAKEMCAGLYFNGICDVVGTHYEAAIADDDGVYQIGNAGQLFWFAEQVNSGQATINAELTSDIDLENKEWTPIGRSDSIYYKGTFDGNRHEISNMCITRTSSYDSSYLGLFGVVLGGTVKNFTVEGDITVYTGEAIGGAVGLMSYSGRSAMVIGVTSKVNITGTQGCRLVGGIVGNMINYNESADYVYDCINYGNIELGKSRECIGGIVGYAYERDCIKNCVNFGDISAYGTVDIEPSIGGILGYQRHKMNGFSGNLNLGNVTDTSGRNTKVGALVGWFKNDGKNTTSSSNNYALVGTCWYLQGTNDESKKVTGEFVTKEQLASGEVAYLLSASYTDSGFGWGQDIGTDPYPVIPGNRVYRGYDGCKVIYSNDYSVSNTSPEDHPGYSKEGFCVACGAYQRASYDADEKRYEIENMGQLFWFAGKVNGTLPGDDPRDLEDIGVCAVLTADIDLQGREWTPMELYLGTFDGAGHKIIGMYVNATNSYAGFIGHLKNGTVKNLTIEGQLMICCDNEFCFGGIVGLAEGTSAEIFNCHSYVDIESRLFVRYTSHCGGVVGSTRAGPNIISCSYHGDCIITGTVEGLGGITGYANENVIIFNCGHYGSITAPLGYWVSGILGYVNNTSFHGVQNCLSVGHISGRSHVGHIVGWARNYASNTIINNYLLPNDDCPSALGKNDQTSKKINITRTNADELKSGKITSLLNDTIREELRVAWGQELGKDIYPVIGGKTVYCMNLDCQGNVSYSNIEPDSDGHVKIGHSAKAPTCTEIGWNEYESCTICEHTTYSELPAMGHNYDGQGICTVCGAHRPRFAGVSLTLENNISVNFKLDPTQFEGTDHSDPYVVFEFNGKEFVANEPVVDYMGLYSFKFENIAPRMMNDTIIATLYATCAKEQVICQTVSYSVKEYCYDMLSRCEDGEYFVNEKVKTLIVDLLNYGEAAQIYGDYKVDTLVTADMTEAQKAWATDDAPELSTVQSLTYKVIEDPSVTWIAGGLLLQDAVTLRFKLDTDSIENLKVKLYTDDDTEGWIVSASDFVETTDGYYVYFDCLEAYQMRETIYLTVYNGDTEVSNTVSYSIESYAYAKQNDSNEKLTSLLEAMMKYGDSAYNYING